MCNVIPHGSTTLEQIDPPFGVLKNRRVEQAMVNRLLAFVYAGEF
jgi:hypothetical protein